MKFKRFFDDIFRAEVFFYWSCSLDKCHEHIGKKLKTNFREWKIDDRLGGQFFVLTTTNEPPIYVVWLLRKKDYYTLTHEVVHLASRILKDRSIDIRDSNQEVLAYYQEYWVKILWKAISK